MMSSDRAYDQPGTSGSHERPHTGTGRMSQGGSQPSQQMRCTECIRVDPSTFEALGYDMAALKDRPLPGPETMALHGDGADVAAWLEDGSSGHASTSSSRSQKQRWRCDILTLQRAASLLRAGQLVAMPTETVYGLAANALDEGAVRRIFAAKGRPADNPLIIHVREGG